MCFRHQLDRAQQPLVKGTCMPDWLKPSLGSGLEVSPLDMALRLAIAFGFGYVIAHLYRLVRRRESTTPTFPPTLVLLAILCALLTQVIGDHVARAFGLVGALSIVRFRTVVEDAYDIAFVIFAVLIGMAAGVNQWQIALLGIGAVGGAALLIHPRRASTPWADADSNLLVRVGVGRNPETLLNEVFRKYLERFDLQETATGRQGTAFDLIYKVRLRSDATPTELVDELNRTEGVQQVDLRRT